MSNYSELDDSKKILLSTIYTAWFLSLLRVFYIHVISVVSNKSLGEVFSTRMYCEGKFYEVASKIINEYLKIISIFFNEKITPVITEGAIGIILAIIVVILGLILFFSGYWIIATICTGIIALIFYIATNAIGVSFIGLNLIIDRLVYSYMDIRIFSFVVIIFISMFISILRVWKLKSLVFTTIIAMIIIFCISNYTSFIKSSYNENIVQYNLTNIYN